MLTALSFFVTTGNFSTRPGTYGYSDCLWNELSGQKGSHPQRSGCQELCVGAMGSSLSFDVWGSLYLGFSPGVTVGIVLYLRVTMIHNFNHILIAFDVYIYFLALMTHFKLRSQTMPSPETCSPWTITAWGTMKTGQFDGWLWKVWLIMSSPALVMW